MVGKEPAMKQAYIYTRVSTTGQLAGYGPERQEEAARAFARAAGYDIAAVYGDAFTGTEADRPQFTTMLTEMMSNGVKVVIVESLDRLARDLFVQNMLLAKLTTEKLTLLAANTGEDVTSAMANDPMRRAMVQIQGVFAELDRNLTVAKLRKGRDARRAKTGRCEGRLPFGSHDGEKATVDYIKALRSQGYTLQKIADTLNAEIATYPPPGKARGYKNQGEVKWNKVTINLILNPKK
jgi:DNA invertase Pin-like site-specific DNA recombinase